MKWAHCLQNIYDLDSYCGNVPHVCHFTVFHPCYRRSSLRVDKETQLLLRLVMQVARLEGGIVWCELRSAENWTKTRDTAAFESIKLFHLQSPQTGQLWPIRLLAPYFVFPLMGQLTAGTKCMVCSVFIIICVVINVKEASCRSAPGMVQMQRKRTILVPKSSKLKKKKKSAKRSSSVLSPSPFAFSSQLLWFAWFIVHLSQFPVSLMFSTWNLLFVRFWWSR